MSKVAIFDDDPLMLQVMINMLAASDVDAIGEADVTKLGDVLSANPDISVLVVDIWHNNRAVFDLLEETADLFADKKLVVISGGGPMSIEMSAAMAQFSRPDAFLSKPFTKQQLLDAVAPKA